MQLEKEVSSYPACYPNKRPNINSTDYMYIFEHISLVYSASYITIQPQLCTLSTQQGLLVIATHFSNTRSNCASYISRESPVTLSYFGLVFIYAFDSVK